MRVWATSERTLCSICRRPVDLARTVDSAAFFEPGDGMTPHRCDPYAIASFRRKVSVLWRALERAGRRDDA